MEILYNKVIGGTSDNILHLGLHVSLSKCCHSTIENLKTHWECTKCRNKDVIIDKLTRAPKPNEMEFIIPQEK